MVSWNEGPDFPRNNVELVWGLLGIGQFECLCGSRILRREFFTW